MISSIYKVVAKVRGVCLREGRVGTGPLLNGKKLGVFMHGGNLAARSDKGLLYITTQS
jgi:hypothetical protein